MKKKLYLLSTILLSATVLSLSSCLKDNRYIDFTKVGTVVDFPLGGIANFSADAITDSGDTIVRQFAVNVASPNVPTTATTLKLAIDNSVISSFPNTTSQVTYEAMPQGSYVFNATSVTIPAGKQYATVSVTFYKSKLDPSKSYMLPIKITGTTAGTISANFSMHYFHFIGNDFAGVYEHYYTRFEQGDTTSAPPSSNRVDEGTDTFYPVDPTHFMVVTDYYYQPSYLVGFTKNGTGSSATYSNWTITFPADQIQQYLTTPSNGSVVLVNMPTFRPLQIAFDPSRSYTYAESLKLFRFYFTTTSRAIFDEFVKQ